MIDMMLDLETLGTRPYSAIVSIGAVFFDPYENKLGDEFYRVVDLRSQGNLGLTMDSATVQWWMQQSDEARAVYKGSGIPVEAALRDLSTFIGEARRDTVRVWGNGSDFDNVLLSCAYEKALLTLPWRYGNNRCYRTVKSFYKGVQLTRVGTYHNALDDAKTQANHLMGMPIWASSQFKEAVSAASEVQP